MKTLWEIREGRDDRSQAAKDRDAGKTTPQSTKKAALAKAKKLSSTMDVGDLYQSSEMDKRIGVMYGSPGYLPPDMEFWDGEGNFDKVIKDIIKNFKSAGLTHIFCNKDPEKKPGKYMSVWIDTIRIKGNHAKIMLAFEKWYTRPGYNNDPDEIYAEDEGQFYHLTFKKDKPSKSGNSAISKHGVQKVDAADKLEWKDIPNNKPIQIAIIKV